MHSASQPIDVPVFTSDYREDVTLTDGTVCTLRMIRPDDKYRLRAILARMSPRSRMNRFFIARGDYNDHELRYLTEVDGIDHLAIIAVRGAESLGVARFVRTDPTGF